MQPDDSAPAIVGATADFLEIRSAVAGIVLGATVPIVMTRRADSAESRVASCEIALLWARTRHGGAA